MACLGRHGRWGNTLLAYLFLRAFAAAHGMAPEVPRWIGQALFGLRDDPLIAHHPLVLYDLTSELCQESRHPMVTFSLEAARALALDGTGGRRLVPFRGGPTTSLEPSLTSGNVDLEGPFLLHTRHLVPFRDDLQAALEPIPEVREPLEQAWQALRQRGDTVIGIHLRRRDFDIAFSQQGFEFVAPMTWYTAWLDQQWVRYRRPVLFVASDSLPDVLPALARYRPVTIHDLGVTLPRSLLHPDLPPAHVDRDATFFPDWFMLARCQALAISNSTFSFTAALMNPAADSFARPAPESRGLAPFEPWNSEPLLFLSPARNLLHDAVRRWALAQRGLGAGAALANLRRALRWYRLVLQVRARASRHFHGRRHLLGEVLRPSFYLAVTRRYDE